MVSADQKVAEIAALSRAHREILRRHRLDLCCGGAHPLRVAALAHGVDLDALLAELEAAGSS